jgi:N-acetylglucosamine-6-phosphate deacetylase
LARTVLVTDATAAAAAPPGQYELAGMHIERSADGSVRVPGASVLAGSSLELDQAVRNVVAWGMGTAGEAIGLASANPGALLAPALAAHGGRIGDGVIEWSPDLWPVSIRAADADGSVAQWYTSPAKSTRGIRGSC